jgi:prevent-host-death family protein
MKSVPVSKFKTRCLSLMEDVHKTGEAIVITKRGKPIAKLVAADEGKRDFIGRLKGVFQIVGDIESPVVPAETWNTFKD